MSWSLIIILFVIACLVGAFGLSEWLVRRAGGSPRNDRDSLT